MSRIGKKIHPLPPGVSAEIKDTELLIKGPKGELSLALPAGVKVIQRDRTLAVEIKETDNTRQRALWGTISSLIGNMITGVTAGFSRQLEISGVGYKATLRGSELALEIGLSHPIVIPPRAGVSFKVEKNIITVAGPDKQAVGQLAAEIRATKKPEPYKGKGIKYGEEVIRRKAGKTAAKTAAA
ncbi:MAG: 50S ribosomal protein L6 [Candidatus Magasanikbacteria bacterium]|nr:50S ribosomal protein L6 [Candidatus Magasanikbacteria bacterium]